jgi:hypothetical protein
MSEMPESETFDPLQLVDPSLADRLFLRAESAVETWSSVFPPPDPRPLSMPVRSAGVGDLLGAYASGNLAPAKVLDDLTAAIATDPSGPEAVVAMVPGALQLAEESGRRWQAGTARPLEGVPFGVKDIIDVEGALVTSGSLFTGERRAPKDAAVAILPRHGDARAVQDRHDERHDASGAPADRCFHRAHRLAPYWLADAFEDDDLEEDGADEHDGGKQMQRDEDEMAHDRCLCAQPVTAPSLAGRASAANFASTPRR